MPPDSNESILESLLTRLGIPTGPFLSMIDTAVREGWGALQFQAQLYSSPTFHNMFPGIFREDGSLKMSASRYRAMSDQYSSIARTYGVELDKARLGSLIGGDTSIQELTDRLEAVKRLQEYGPAMKEFQQVLASRGIKSGDGDMVNFILGKAPKQFYSIWEETQVGTAARTAGVHISQGLVRKISRQLPGIQSEQDVIAGFQDLATKIQSVMPMSKIAKYGISRRDLTELEFGGPHQAAIAERVQNLINSTQAFYTGQRAQGQLPVGGRGSAQRAQAR